MSQFINDLARNIMAFVPDCMDAFIEISESDNDLNEKVEQALERAGCTECEDS